MMLIQPSQLSPVKFEQAADTTNSTCIYQHNTTQHEMRLNDETSKYIFFIKPLKTLQTHNNNRSINFNPMHNQQ